MRILRVVVPFLLAVVASSAGAAPVQEELAQAAENGQVAFILVTDRDAAGIAGAKEKIEQAMGLVDGSVLVEFDRSDPANAELVAKYRLAGAPVPLILIAARNGILAAGLPAERATADQLAGLVPSPKKAEILEALQDGQAVFVVASRGGTAGQSANAACTAACGAIPSGGTTVEIDLADPAETEFVAQLKIDPNATEPVTLVINPQGQIAGTYAGTPDIASLAQAATRKVGGCCPPTAQNPNASCAPPKK